MSLSSSSDVQTRRRRQQQQQQQKIRQQQHWYLFLSADTFVDIVTACDDTIDTCIVDTIAEKSPSNHDNANNVNGNGNDGNGEDNDVDDNKHSIDRNKNKNKTALSEIEFVEQAKQVWRENGHMRFGKLDISDMCSRVPFSLTIEYTNDTKTPTVAEQQIAGSVASVPKPIPKTKHISAQDAWDAILARFSTMTDNAGFKATIETEPAPESKISQIASAPHAPHASHASHARRFIGSVSSSLPRADRFPLTNASRPALEAMHAWYVHHRRMRECIRADIVQLPPFSRVDYDLAFSFWTDNTASLMQNKDRKAQKEQQVETAACSMPIKSDTNNGPETVPKECRGNGASHVVSAHCSTHLTQVLHTVIQKCQLAPLLSAKRLRYVLSTFGAFLIGAVVDFSIRICAPHAIDSSRGINKSNGDATGTGGGMSTIVEPTPTTTTANITSPPTLLCSPALSARLAQEVPQQFRVIDLVLLRSAQNKALALANYFTKLARRKGIKAWVVAYRNGSKRLAEDGLIQTEAEEPWLLSSSLPTATTTNPPRYVPSHCYMLAFEGVPCNIRITQFSTVDRVDDMLAMLAADYWQCGIGPSTGSSDSDSSEDKDENGNNCVFESRYRQNPLHPPLPPPLSAFGTPSWQKAHVTRVTRSRVVDMASLVRALRVHEDGYFLAPACLVDMFNSNVPGAVAYYVIATGSKLADCLPDRTYETAMLDGCIEPDTQDAKSSVASSAVSSSALSLSSSSSSAAAASSPILSATATTVTTTNDAVSIGSSSETPHAIRKYLVRVCAESDASCNVVLSEHNIPGYATLVQNVAQQTNAYYHPRKGEHDAYTSRMLMLLLESTCVQMVGHDGDDDDIACSQENNANVTTATNAFVDVGTSDTAAAAFAVDFQSRANVDVKNDTSRGETRDVTGCCSFKKRKLVDCDSVASHKQKKENDNQIMNCAVARDCNDDDDGDDDNNSINNEKDIIDMVEFEAVADDGKQQHQQRHKNNLATDEQHRNCNDIVHADQSVLLMTPSSPYSLAHFYLQRTLLRDMPDIKTFLTTVGAHMRTTYSNYISFASPLTLCFATYIPVHWFAEPTGSRYQRAVHSEEFNKSDKGQHHLKMQTGKRDERDVIDVRLYKSARGLSECSSLYHSTSLGKRIYMPVEPYASQHPENVEKSDLLWLFDYIYARVSNGVSNIFSGHHQRHQRRTGWETAFKERMRAATANNGSGDSDNKHIRSTSLDVCHGDDADDGDNQHSDEDGDDSKTDACADGPQIKNGRNGDTNDDNDVTIGYSLRPTDFGDNDILSLRSAVPSGAEVSSFTTRQWNMYQLCSSVHVSQTCTVTGLESHPEELLLTRVLENVSLRDIFNKACVRRNLCFVHIAFTGMYSNGLRADTTRPILYLTRIEFLRGICC